ncbi:MAG: ABC transporter permease [Gammaproteobacteria bacterium]|nr:ABC transporter permease [Gammaproteobacteria bacterium]
MQTPIKTITILAWRNLWRNYRRTFIMLAAITVGAWAMIFMTALMRGMVDEMIKDGIRSLPGHVQIHHPLYRDDPSITNSLSAPSKQLLTALKQDDVIAWSTRVRVPAVISSERDSRGIILVGIDPVAERSITNTADNISEGRFLTDKLDNGLVIGAALAKRLDTQPGKRVVVMSQDPDNEIADRGFRIVGLYQATIEAMEENTIYAARDTVQKLLKMGDQISEVVILGKDYRDVSTLTENIKSAAANDTEVLPWQELDTYLGTMLKVMDGFVFVWIVVIFLALSFGLANTLIMAVFERVREIGLMQALGMRPSGILYQFMLEAFFLLTIGLGIGNIAAVASIKPLESGIDLSVVAEGMAMMGAGSTLYPALYISDIILANIIVIILGLLTSLVPAWRASRYDPVEAITKT